MNDGLIETKVNEFVTDDKGFTSVDICNAIKTDGTWIPNREVAKWLRSWSAPVGYGISKVTVFLQGGDTVQAAVYMPNTRSIADYTETSQGAMTPAEFETLHGKKPFGDADTPLAVASASDDPDDDGGDGSQSAGVGDKLRSLFKWPKGSS
jgi:hypothetical protein